MSNVSSQSQLRAQLGIAMEKSIKQLIDKIENVIKEHVDTDVYAVGSILGRINYYSGTAEPTGLLRDSIKVNVVQEGLSVYFDVINDPDIMGSDPFTFLHGSDYYSPNDVSSFLGKLINNGDTGGLFGAKWEGLKRPFLTNADEELKRKIPLWWNEILRRNLK